MQSLVSRPRLLAAAAFTITLVVRLAELWRLSQTPYAEPVTADMRFYAEWATRIAQGQLTDFHAFYGQPLYAYLLAAIFSVTGFQPLLVASLQAVLDAFTALLIFRVALLVFREAPRRAVIIGMIAAIGWASFVPAAAYSLLLIPAAWTTATWWFCAWWLLRRAGRAPALEWLASGALVGVVAMMSAALLFVVPLFIARALMRRSAARAAAVAAGILVGTAPAWMHNALVARDPVFLSAHSGLNFWIGNNPEANGYPRVPRELPSEQGELLRGSIVAAERAAGRELKRSEVSTFWSAKARDYIASHPAEWVRLLGVKTRNFWNEFAYDDLSSITALRDARVIPAGLSFGMVAAFALPGLLLSLSTRRARWIAAIVLLQLLALVPVFVNERYRIAAVPGLLLLGAAFVVHVWCAFAKLNWRRVGGSMLLLVASVWFVTLPAGEPTLRSVDDYKTARRQIRAGEFSAAERRLRLAVGAMVPASQIPAAVAAGFVDAAEERLKDGDAAHALAIVEHALRVQPSDARARALHARLTNEG